MLYFSNLFLIFPQIIKTHIETGGLDDDMAFRLRVSSHRRHILPGQVSLYFQKYVIYIVEFYFSAISVIILFIALFLMLIYM